MTFGEVLTIKVRKQKRTHARFVCFCFLFFFGTIAMREPEELIFIMISINRLKYSDLNGNRKRLSQPTKYSRFCCKICSFSPYSDFGLDFRFENLFFYESWNINEICRYTDDASAVVSRALTRGECEGGG